MAREECNVGSLYNWWPNLQIANSWNQYNNYSSNSSGDVDEDVSMFTNVSNDHSGVTIESFDQSVSTKEMVSETETPGADHQPWSHLVLSGSNGDFQDNRDVGDDLLNQFSSKIFPNDHLKKMESTGWDFTTSLFFNTLNNPLKESSCSVEQTQTLNKPSNPTFNHNSILNHTATGNTPFIDQSHHLQTSNFSDPKKRVNDQLPISYLFNRSTKGTSSIVTRRNVKAQRAPRNITQGKKKRSSDEESSNTLVKKPMLQHPKHSSIKTQVPKVKLTDKITALQQIVSPFGKTDTASVLWEAICYVRFLQEQIQLLMSNPYMKSNSCKDPWGNMEGDLRSRGLCLVPISFTPQIYGDDNGCDYFTPPYRGSLYR